MANKGAPINSPKHQNDIDEQIQGAFSDFVRKERRNLLFVSAISGFLAGANISPSKVNALGLEISNLKPRFIYCTLLILCIYYFIAYWLHAEPEYRKMKSVMRTSFGRLNEYLTPPLTQRVKCTVDVWWRYLIWVVFDYWAPILIGLLAIIVLIYRVSHSA